MQGTGKVEVSNTEPQATSNDSAGSNQLTNPADNNSSVVSGSTNFIFSPETQLPCSALTISYQLPFFFFLVEQGASFPRIQLRAF